jgi:hypothetical protein
MSGLSVRVFFWAVWRFWPAERFVYFVPPEVLVASCLPCFTRLYTLIGGEYCSAEKMLNFEGKMPARSVPPASRAEKCDTM